MVDTADELELQPRDVQLALAALAHAWRHDGDARQRYARIERLLRPMAKERPRYVFLREPGSWWVIGPEHDPRPYRDDADRRGLVLARIAIEQGGQLVGHDEIRHFAPGGMKQTALCQALANSRDWLQRTTGCAPIVRAVGAVKAYKTGIAYRPEDPSAIQIITAA